VTYDAIARTYVRYRRPDPRIGAAVIAALGEAPSVANIGAGAGSYEPDDRVVVAVERSATMIASRRPGSAPAVRGRAEQLPLRTDAVSASLAVLTVHHWDDIARGLAEMRRVARDRVVILTWDPAAEPFWLVRDYFPELIAEDRRIFPPIGQLEAAFGELDVQGLPVPADCVDGFLGAYWRRPEAYLDPDVRACISTFGRLTDVTRGLARLRQDLDSGEWHRRNADVLAQDELGIGYCMVIARG
jgi:SAM-dependent methyltransferase